MDWDPSSTTPVDTLDEVPGPVFKPFTPTVIPSSTELARFPMVPKALVAVDITEEPADARADPNCDASCSAIAEALSEPAEPSIKLLLLESET
jgi:hypothetical protein